MDPNHARFNGSPNGFGPPMAAGMAGGAVAGGYRGGVGGPPRGGFPARGRGRYPQNGLGPNGYNFNYPMRGRGYPRGRGGFPPAGPPPGTAVGMRAPSSYDDGTNIDSYYEDTSAQLPRLSPGPFNDPQGSDSTPSPPVVQELDGAGTERKSPNRELVNPEYVPPRSEWSSKPGHPAQFPGRTLTPIQGSPAIDLSRSPPSDGLATYVEDVDPRFADNGPTRTSSLLPPGSYRPHSSSNNMPVRFPANNTIHHSSSANDLRQPPMIFANDNQQPIQYTPQQRFLRPQPVVGSNDYLLTSYDSLPLTSGQRSPGNISESSHFTSVSQRGINPAWRPRGRGPPGPSREDIILDANPDFALPPGRGGFRGRGRGKGSLGGFGPGRAGSLPNELGPGGGGGSYPRLKSLTGGSRYPEP